MCCSAQPPRRGLGALRCKIHGEKEAVCWPHAVVHAPSYHPAVGPVVEPMGSVPSAHAAVRCFPVSNAPSSWALYRLATS